MVETSTIVTAVILIVLIAPTIGFFIGSVAINIAEYTKGSCDFPEGVCRIGTAIGIPTGWLNTQNFLWFAIIPLCGVWLTVYGFMSKLRFFGKGVMAGLSFIIAFSTIPLGLFVVMVVAIYQLMGFYAIIGLAILFFVGVFFQVRGGVGKMTGEFEQIKNLKENERKIKKQIDILDKAYKKSQDDLKKQEGMTQAGAIEAMDENQKLKNQLDKKKEELKRSETQRKRFTTLAKKYRKASK